MNAPPRTAPPYPFEAYDRHGSLKPSLLAGLVMFYSVHHLLLIFLLYFPLMPGRAELAVLHALLSLPAALAELPALLLLIAWRQRQLAAAAFWGERRPLRGRARWDWLWRRGRTLLLLTLTAQALLLANALWGWVPGMAADALAATVLPPRMAVHALVIAYVVFSRRLRALFRDFPPAPEPPAPAAAVPAPAPIPAAPEVPDAAARAAAADRHARGLRAAAAGALDAAAQLLADAVALHPEHAHYWRDLCEIQRRLGRLEAAIASGRTAVRLARTAASAHYNLGLALADAGRIPAAMQRYLVAARLDPASGRAWNNLGVLYWQSGRPEAARAAFVRALTASPRLDEARRNLDALRAARSAASPAPEPTVKA